MATRDEIDEAVRTGLPTLVEAAREQGAETFRELNRAVDKFVELMTTFGPTE